MLWATAPEKNSTDTIHAFDILEVKTKQAAYRCDQRTDFSTSRKPTMKTIKPNDLHAQIQRGERIELIDVRTPIEFREVHAEPASNVPLDQLDPKAIAAQRHGKADPLYVICRSGGRASKAIEQLAAAGVQNLVNVEGGTLAWESAGLPVQRGKKAMSLERQVRIAAGSLVCLGFILSFLHPYFIGLSMFVGLGLVFAGITDTCAMGMMIAKMPWNKVKTSSPNQPKAATM